MKKVSPILKTDLPQQSVYLHMYSIVMLLSQWGMPRMKFKAIRNTRMTLIASSMLDNLELISANGREGGDTLLLSRKRPQLDPVIAEIVSPAALVTWTIFVIS